MSDRFLIGCVVVLFMLLCLTWFGWQRAIVDSDAWRARVDGLNVQMIRGCVAHPDGSGECKAGTFPTTTTIAVP